MNPVWQTQTPPLLVRVQLVGGPLDGECVFAVPGAPVCVERLVQPQQQHPFLGWFGMGQSATDDWQKPKRTKAEKAKVQVAVYSARRGPDEMWMPLLGFDGIVDMPVPDDLRGEVHPDNNEEEEI